VGGGRWKGNCALEAKSTGGSERADNTKLLPTWRKIDAAFATLVGQRVAALVVMADEYFDGARRAQLVALAALNAIPALYGQREYALEGGLITYGTNLKETFRRGGQLCRPYSQRRKAERFAGCAADQVRVGHQSKDRQDARP